MTEPHDDLHARARQGVLLVSLRGLALRIVGVGGNVALARLLAPTEFGRVAVALALVGAGRFVVDAGFGASLIRAREVPRREDLATAAAAQLFVAVAVLLGCLGVAAFGGVVARLTAVVALSLPFVSLRSATTIQLERQLEFRPVLAAETIEATSSMISAVLLAALGAGAFGVAVGVVVGSVGGTAALARLARGTWVRPWLHRDRLRALLSLGFAQQALGMLNVLRDQGVNVGIYLILGSGPLGLWTIAYRLLQVPFLLFEGLWRVSFPAMSRLVGQKADVRPILERSVAVAGVWTGLLVGALVACAPVIVPVLLGNRWSDAVVVLPAAGVSLVVGGPVSAAAAGFLFAVGDARCVLRATIVHTACWLVVGLSLLPVLGLVSISLGWLVGGVAETALFSRALSRHAGARVFPIVVRTALPAILGGGVGWTFAHAGHPTWARGLMALLLTVGAYVGFLAMVDRPSLRAAAREVLRLGQTA